MVLAQEGWGSHAEPSRAPHVLRIQGWNQCYQSVLGDIPKALKPGQGERPVLPRPCLESETHDMLRVPFIPQLYPTFKQGN